MFGSAPNCAAKERRLISHSYCRDFSDSGRPSGSPCLTWKREAPWGLPGLRWKPSAKSVVQNSPWAEPHWIRAAHQFVLSSAAEHRWRGRFRYL